ncbi:MAG: rod shape-determining protein MreC [Anaerohalosphaeraceae bacterium]
MAFRNIHAPRGSLFIGLLILSILILVIPHSLTKRLNFAFRSLFSPVLEIGRKLSIDPIRMAQNPELVVEKTQYNQLWKNFKNLEAKMAEVERENLFLGRVRKQYGLGESGLLLARVSTLLLTARHEAIINQGTQASVQAGQIVLSAGKNSVIGTVKDVSEKMARVALITDSTHGIEVRIRRDGTRMDIPAQMFGDGKSGCRIGFIPKDIDVRVGDTVYAATQGGKLDVPVVIGEVLQVVASDQDPLIWDIRVRPIETLTSLKEVVVIIPVTAAP